MSAAHQDLPMSSRLLMTLTLAVALLGALALPAMAQPQPAMLQPAGSEIAFTTRQLGVPVEGKFARFSAQIALDPKQPSGGSVVITIDTGSARFGSAELDAEVPKPEWLAVARFPQAGFRSSAIKATGPGRFDVAGKLLIKGIARDVTVPVQLVQSGATGKLLSTASGSFVIKRLAFSVGEGEWTDTSMLSDDVQVRFKLVLSGLAPL